MPSPRQSEFPEPLPLRPKTLSSSSGTYRAALPPMPLRKPAVAKRDPERLREEILMALALDITMRTWLDDSGQPMTNVRLAASVGCAEVIVRDLRKRHRPIQGRHIAKMPQDFRAALIHAFDVQLRAPLALAAADAANDVD